MFFCYFLRNRRFCENALKHWLCAQKSRFELEKNKKKSPKNRFPNVLEKNTAKNLSKFDFYSHLGLPKPPKISPKSAKIEKKSPSKMNSEKRPMELNATRRNSPEGKLFGTPPDHPSTLPKISNSLSIYLSIHPSIY